MSLSIAHIYSKILEVSEKSYYRWKSKDHTILVNLLEKYFTKEELEEYLKNGKIEKLELVKSLSIEELENKLANVGNYERDQRVQEIVRLFKIYSFNEISNTFLATLIEQYNNYSIGIDTTLINKLQNITNYLNFLEEFLNILEDMKLEKDSTYNEVNNNIFKEFNKEIGFDFSVYDIKPIKYLITRYYVYNTLHEIDQK